jgi:hypothetical protein
MSAAVKRGYNGKLYYNSGSYGSPTWIEIQNIKEAKVTAAFDKYDATTRQGAGVKQYAPTLFDPMFSAKIRSDETDTSGYIPLETAFYGRAVLDVLFLDGARTLNGSRGLRMDVCVFKWDEDQDNDAVDFRDFELAPTVSSNLVYTAVVTAGAPVFTVIAA